MKTTSKPNLKNWLPYVLATVLIAVISVGGCRRESPADARPLTNVPLEDSLDRMLKSGVMKVGYIHYPPAVIKDPRTGDLSGDFVEIARYIAGELKLKLDFQEATWSTFVTGLQTRQYDISIASTYIKVGRSANVAYSRPIAYLGNSAGVRADDTRFKDVRSPMEFDRDGLVIAVVQGESAHEYVTAHFHNIKKENLRVLSGSDLAAPLALVASGQVDVGLTDAYVTRTFCKKNKNVRDIFTEKPYDVSPMAWAVRPDDYRLLNFINNSLDFLEASGKLTDWRKKYDASWLVKAPHWETD